MAQAIERLYKLEVDASQAVRQLKSINKNTNTLATGFRNLQRATAATFAVFGAARGIAGIANAQDKIELLAGSFTALLESGDRSADMMERVFRTVQDTGAGLDDTASAFQRLSIGLREVGASNEQIDAVANTFIKLGRISGTSMTDTNAALVQFSQGLASGKLQGDELRSIMERLPLITELLADEFSLVNDDIEVTRGQIKQLGKEGLITAEIMGNALIRASEEIATTFETLVYTLDQELNSLKATAVILLAELSSATGFGDGLKTGISGANTALAAFGSNIGQFIKDVKTLVGWFTEMDAALYALAGVITIALLPAILKVDLALVAMVKKNPILTFVGVAISALTLLIANWDYVRALFLFKVPSWFATLQATVEQWAGGFSIAVQNVWQDVENFFIRGINAVIERFNRFSAGLEDLTGGKVSFGSVDTLELKKAEEATTSFFTNANLSRQRAIELEGQYQAALAETAKEAGKTGLLSGGADPEETKALEKHASALEKFKNQMLDTVDPSRELARNMALLNELFASGEINMVEFGLIRDELDGSAEAMRNAAEEWDKYVEATRRSLDPSIAYREELARINRLWAESKVNFVEYMELRKRATEELEDTAESTGKTISGLQADLTQAGNAFVSDFSDGMVDALLEGELAFGDFAKSILEDLARMILRAVIFNSLMGALGGLGIPGLGTPVTKSVEGGSFGPTLLAGGSPSTNAVGVIQPPTYGKGGYGSANGGVNITVNNNAPVEVQTSSKTNSNGGTDIDIMIERKVNTAMSNGGFDKAMSSNYGIKRRGY